MAINPYEPELSKRRTAFEIAYTQLNELVYPLRNSTAPDLRQKMEKVEEAMNDYKETGYALAEWLEQKPED